MSEQYIVVNRYERTADGTHYGTLIAAQDKARSLSKTNKDAEFLVCEVKDTFSFRFEFNKVKPMDEILDKPIKVEALQPGYMQHEISNIGDDVLRDYFAAQVIPSLMHSEYSLDRKWLSATAYEVADAMMEARKR